MGNDHAIPQASREVVVDRERGLCVRCAGPGRHWHHRRSRRRRGEHRHCPCNGVWLCPTCHEWAHKYPIAAKEEGYVIPTVVDEPAQVTFLTWWGRVKVDCVGNIDWVSRT